MAPPTDFIYTNRITPAKIEVGHETRDVMFKKSGYNDEIITDITVNPGETKSVHATLEAKIITGTTVAVLQLPHTVPAEAKKGSTARFKIKVTTEPKTKQTGYSYPDIEAKVKVRIAHSSLTPEYSGESTMTALSIGAVASLPVDIPIPTTAKTGDYKVYAEVFTREGF